MGTFALSHINMMAKRISIYNTAFSGTKPLVNTMGDKLFTTYRAFSRLCPALLTKFNTTGSCNKNLATIYTYLFITTLMIWPQFRLRIAFPKVVGHICLLCFFRQFCNFPVSQLSLVKQPMMVRAKIHNVIWRISSILRSWNYVANFNKPIKPTNKAFFTLLFNSYRAFISLCPACSSYSHRYAPAFHRAIFSVWPNFSIMLLKLFSTNRANIFMNCALSMRQAKRLPFMVTLKRAKFAVMSTSGVIREYLTTSKASSLFNYHKPIIALFLIITTSTGT